MTYAAWWQGEAWEPEGAASSVLLDPENRPWLAGSLPTINGLTKCPPALTAYFFLVIMKIIIFYF